MAGVVDGVADGLNTAKTGLTGAFGTTLKVSKPVVFGAMAMGTIGILSTVGWPALVANISTGVGATAGFLSGTAQLIAAHSATAATALAPAAAGMG